MTSSPLTSRRSASAAAKHALALLAARARTGATISVLVRARRRVSSGSASRRTMNGTSTGVAGRPARPRGRGPTSPAARSTRGQHAPGRPTRAASSDARIDGQPRRERRGRARRVASRSRSICGPGRLGVDVVDGHRRDAAPVVDAGVEQGGEVARRQVRRRLHDDLGGQDRAAPRRSSRAGPRACGSGAPPSWCPGLARKFWTITSCRWPWRRVQRRAARSSASIRSSSRLADADQDAAW